jgi:hypothetical protein
MKQIPFISSTTIGKIKKFLNEQGHPFIKINAGELSSNGKDNIQLGVSCIKLDQVSISIEKLVEEKFGVKKPKNFKSISLTHLLDYPGKVYSYILYLDDTKEFIRFFYKNKFMKKVISLQKKNVPFSAYHYGESRDSLMTKPRILYFDPTTKIFKKTESPLNIIFKV